MHRADMHNSMQMHEYYMLWDLNRAHQVLWDLNRAHQVLQLQNHLLSLIMKCK